MSKMISDDLPFRRWYDEQQTMTKFLTNLFGFEPSHRHLVGNSLSDLAKGKYQKHITKQGFSLAKGGVTNYVKSYNKRRRYDKVHGMHKTMLTHSLLSEPRQLEMGQDCYRLTELVKDYIRACNFYGFRENDEHIETLSRTYSKKDQEEARRLLLSLKQNLKKVAAEQILDGTKLAPKL